jgi:arylsulfatase A-like enzyme
MPRSRVPQRNFVFSFIFILSLVFGRVCLADGNHQLTIVVDGLRPDYVEEDLMPNLYRWSREGIVFKNHHAVFPTVTRVNASSFATGCYPWKHGLLGNTVYFPKVEKAKGLSTSSLENLRRIEESEGGRLLSAPTVGEILQANGKKMAAVSSGSAGSCYLLNHKVSGGAVFHTAFTLPEELHESVIEKLGPPPEEGYPNEGPLVRAVDTYLKIVLSDFQPDVTYLWMTEPDHTAHKHGMGAPETERALALVDREFGRILTRLEEKGLLDRINLFVTSDHGFSMHTGRPHMDLPMLLIQNGLKAVPDSEDVVISEGAVYVQEGGAEKVEAIVALLLRTPWVGPVFTRAKEKGSLEGSVPGTLSFETVRWGHERSGDILVAPYWTDAANEYGFKGTTTNRGVAGHGSASRWDIHNTLLARGPDLKSGIESEAPTANVDLAPTLLKLCGVDPPESMDGRVLAEAFLDSDAGGETEATDTEEIERESDGMFYRVELQTSKAGSTSYVDYVRAARKKFGF